MRGLCASAIIASLCAIYIFVLNKTDKPANSYMEVNTSVHVFGGNSSSEFVSQAELPRGGFIETGDFKENARDEQVKEKLKTFLDRTAFISAKSIQEERLRVAKGLENAAKKTTEMPSVRNFKDSNNDEWLRLQFSNGIVRYALKEPEQL